MARIDYCDTSKSNERTKEILNKNRNAIADNFLTEVAKNADGTLYNKLIKVIPQVNQTLGIPEAEFLALGRANRDNPNCP